MTSIFFKRDLAGVYHTGYQKYHIYFVYDLLRVIKLSGYDIIHEYGLVTCAFGNVECVKYLIDIGYKNTRGGIKLAIRHGNVEIVKLMLTCGVTTVDIAMYEAIVAEQMEIIELLTKWDGIDWNRRLMTACAIGNKRIIELMISHGATECDWYRNKKHPTLSRTVYKY